MGIFDSLKNMTNQAVKNNVSKAVSGAVNNAMHKSKTFVFADYPKNADELKKMPELDFSSPLSTAAFAMLVLLEYDESPENTIEMLNVLKGPQPMNGMDVQFLRDRIKGRGYIPRSYFEGSSVKNDYTPNVPYKITVSEYAYTYQSEGYAKVQVQSSGADSPRPIELRRKGNQWFLWRNLALSDIRTPASADPWAYRCDFYENQEKSKAYFERCPVCAYAFNGSSYDSHNRKCGGSGLYQIYRHRGLHRRCP